MRFLGARVSKAAAYIKIREDLKNRSDEKIASQKILPLRELEASAGFLTAILLTLNSSAVTS